MQTALLRKDEKVSSEVLALLSSGAVVVKPIDAGHGKGITTNITTRNGLFAAITYAHEFTKSNDSIIVQRMYENPLDLRLLCIDGKMVAAAIRQPARVLGNGVNTVGELIEQENATKRGIPYRSDLAFIDVNRAAQYLGERVQEIPESGQYVSVLGTANVGSGGEAIDCTDNIPQWMSELACQIANAAALPVCGVDFMVTHAPSVESTREQLSPAVTEINKCPSFGLHHQPTSGMVRDVTSAYFDYLATL
jgi:cyanophycin synthetase